MVQCYEELLSKFSGSASLHLDFAHFCEAVLNDEARARKYRHGAEILETGAPFAPLPLPLTTACWITRTRSGAPVLPFGVRVHCMAPVPASGHTAGCRDDGSCEAQGTLWRSRTRTPRA